MKISKKSAKLRYYHIGATVKKIRLITTREIKTIQITFASVLTLIFFIILRSKIARVPAYGLHNFNYIKIASLARRATAEGVPT